MEQKNDLKSLARLFLRLGTTAFGGPVAHIAMMQKEVVDKRGWMDHAHFMDLIGATNLIPGPNSTEMAIHIGYERGRWKGLILAGCCFILPAVVMTAVIAWLYQRYGELPKVQAFTYGIKPAIIAIILGAGYPLAKRTIKTLELALIGAVTFLAILLGIDEIYAMFGAGFLALALYMMRRQRPPVAGLIPWVFLQVPSMDISNARLFLIFFKIGAILYGSGYVLFGFLDHELVAKGLLSRHTLIDAIAVGQFTPGPVFSSVTFIGWQMNGWKGAALATVAIFLPSFLLVALLNPLVPKMRTSRIFSAFLDGVNVASVAIILTVCISFARETITDWRTIVIACLSALVVFGWKRVNTVWVVAGGAALGYVLSMV